MAPPVPRLDLDDLPADLADALQPRVVRLGYLGEFFKCAAHQPKVLSSFMTFTDDLKDALPGNLTEVVALTVATVMRNRYERHQHERLSRKLGFADDWIRDLTILEGAHLSDTERSVQALTMAIIARQGHGVAPEFEVVVAAIGHTQAMAILFLVGRYVTHSLIVNALDLAPPVPSIFDDPS